MAVNISDRQIVDTEEQDSSVDFRVPAVKISGVEISTPSATPDSSSESPDFGGMGVPRNITLESQSVRVQPDGSTVIDVVLSYDEAAGASKHEVRISRV